MTSELGEPRTISANGIDFGYLEIDGGGPLAICMHGFPDTAYSWRYLLPELAAAGYRAVAPFQRGYAPTGLATDGYQTGALGADVNALHEALGGDERAVLIGQDYGAMATYAALGKEPERWRRAVTVGAPPHAALETAFRDYDKMQRSFFIYMLQIHSLDSVLESDPVGFFEYLWSYWAAPGYDATEDMAFLAESVPDLAHVEAITKGYYRSLHQPQLHEEKYAEYQAAGDNIPKVPLLYLHGTEDGILPARLVENSGRVLGADGRFELVEGAGHFVHVEKPEDFNPRVLAWLGSA